jgi:hypothetical protein
MLQKPPQRFTRSSYEQPAIRNGLSPEEQKNQETIEYAYQPQYGAPVEIHGSNLSFLSLDHGSTSSPMVANPSGLPYLPISMTKIVQETC